MGLGPGAGGWVAGDQGLGLVGQQELLAGGGSSGPLPKSMRWLAARQQVADGAGQGCGQEPGSGQNKGNC